jgi:hypothetical protein
MSTTRGSNINKIDNTFTRIMGEMNKFEQVFKQEGSLERAIMDVGGDPSDLKYIVETFADLYDKIESAHYSAVGHVTEQLSKKKKISPNTPASMVAEGVLDGDDEDGFMARSQLYFLAKDAITLHGVINDRDDLAPWVQTKIAQASKDMDSVRRYTEYNAVEDEASPEMPHSHEAPHAQEPEQFEAEAPHELPEEAVVEGTWAVPESPEDIEALTAIMQNELPVGEDGDNASNVMYNILGDDDLFDEFIDMAHTMGPDTDARPAIENRLKELGLMEGMDFNGKRTDELQVVAKDLFKNALANAKKKQKQSKVAEDVNNGPMAPAIAPTIKPASKPASKAIMKPSKKLKPRRNPQNVIGNGDHVMASKVSEGNYPEPRTMEITDIDAKGKTPAWKAWKAGNPKYSYKGHLQPADLSGSK